MRRSKLHRQPGGYICFQFLKTRAHNQISEKYHNSLKYDSFGLLGGLRFGKFGQPQLGLQAT